MELALEHVKIYSITIYFLNQIILTTFENMITEHDLIMAIVGHFS
jgi:hypothetical protein